MSQQFEKRVDGVLETPKTEKQNNSPKTKEGLLSKMKQKILEIDNKITSKVSGFVERNTSLMKKKVLPFAFLSLTLFCFGSANFAKAAELSQGGDNSTSSEQITQETDSQKEINEREFQEALELRYLAATAAYVDELAHNPNHKDNEHGFDGECVSTVNMINYKVSGVKFGFMPSKKVGDKWYAQGPEQAWYGNYNATFASKDWQRVEMKKNTEVRVGDNLISVAGPYGHIATVVGVSGNYVFIAESNVNGDSDKKSPDYLKKIKVKKLTKQQVETGYVGFFRPVIPDGNKKAIIESRDAIEKGLGEYYQSEKQNKIKGGLVEDGDLGELLEIKLGVKETVFTPKTEKPANAI